MTQYDALLESKQKKRKKSFILLYLVVAVILSTFHLYTSFLGNLEPWLQRATHLGLVLIIAFMVPFTKESKKSIPKLVVDVILLLLSILFLLYSFLSYPAISERAGDSTLYDKVFTLILVVLLLIASKRFLGWALPIIAGVFIVYTFVGPYLPGVFTHNGFSTGIIVDQLFISMSGIMGPAIAASSVFISIFL